MDCACDDAAVECGVLPENASDPRLEYAVAPDGVVALEPGGVLRALAEGEATERDDIIYLEKLPVFHPDGSVIE